MLKKFSIHVAFTFNSNHCSAGVTIDESSVLILFQTDKGFDKSIFNKQMSVMRGQVSIITQ